MALRQILPLEPFHRDVRQPLVELSEGDDADDPGVFEPGEQPSLAPEARLLAGVDAGNRDDLERHGRTQVDVDCTVRCPHGAAPKLLEGDTVCGQANFIVLEAAVHGTRFTQAPKQEAVQTTESRRFAFKQRAALFAVQNLIFCNRH